MRVWDSESGECLLTLRHESSVTSVCYSPDGKRIASGSSWGSVKIWDSESGGCLETIIKGKWAEVFAKEEVLGFRVVSRPPLETKVRSSSGSFWILYFPEVFGDVATAKKGRIAGFVGNHLVLLEIVGLG